MPYHNNLADAALTETHVLLGQASVVAIKALNIAIQKQIQQRVNAFLSSIAAANDLNASEVLFVKEILLNEQLGKIRINCNQAQKLSLESRAANHHQIRDNICHVIANDLNGMLETFR